jgi:uncharacterized protein YbjT (DUF2867 family)
MYLVTGATGNVGAELVRALSAVDEPVCALARSDPPYRALPADVDVRRGDLTDPSTLGDVWEGIRGVFLLPGYDETRAILQQARAAGVEHVVLLSGGSAGSGDMSNAITAYMVRSESAVRESGLRWTILRPAAFMTNALRWSDQLRAGDVVRLPFAGVRTACVDPSDIAAVACSALLDDRHRGQIYTPTGPESLRPADQVRILGEALHRALTFEAQPDDEARREMLQTTPPQYVEAFFDFYAAGSLDESNVMPTVEQVTGRPPRTFRAWADAHAREFD